jgi:hypothetical protein
MVDPGKVITEVETKVVHEEVVVNHNEQQQRENFNYNN